tara:strand:+ start:2300 stop:3412 length:1113 start_codon:yes stop_codon:yes gene_type:complete
MGEKIFIVIYADEIGGAELRFFGLWKQAIKQNNNRHDYYIVISKELLDVLLLRETIEDRSILKKNKNIVLYDFNIGSKKLKIFVNQLTTKNDIVHFADIIPSRSAKANQIFSITQSSFKNLNFKGQVAQILGAFYANWLDVLDPSIYKTLKKIFFYKRNKISLTTNSYCDIDKFKTIPYKEKKDWFVFLGRFEKGKQVDKLIDILPEIYQGLKDNFNNDLKFIFLGYGYLNESIKNKIKESRFNDVPITIEYCSTPQKILSESKFFFSLQLHNNYPSRSLMEAMSAGNIPICTDIGETRWLAKPEFSFYVPESFSFNDFNEVIETLKNHSQERLEIKSNLARQTVSNEHTIEKMFDYYHSIYCRIHDNHK